MAQVVRLGLVISVLMMFNACGQKGPLLLPEPRNTEPVTSASSEMSQPLLAPSQQHSSSNQ